MKTRIGAAIAAGVLVLSGCGVFRGDGKSDSGTPGVTKDPCPNAVNKKHGCIYLGSISDLTIGPFHALAVPITEAQKAFWKRVNTQGGIGGYDIDVTKYVRDNKYNPQVHNQVYQEIKGKVLALAQTLGSPTTAAIINDLKSSKIVAVPASWTSLWNFEDVMLESGASYCIESMNAIDYAVDTYKPKKIMAVHYAGDYGNDAAAGAKVAAAAHKLSFSAVETPQGQDNQGRAVDAIVKEKPDIVVLTTGPTDAGTVVGQAAARGYKGHYLGTSPSWNKGLLKSPAAPAIKAQYLQSAPWAPFQTDTPGHQAMRAAVGQVDPNDGYTAGWVWSYPLKAALQKAAANKDLTRAGLAKAVKQISSVDYEGMLPPGSGNYAGDPNTGAVRTTLIAQPDDTAPTGVKVIKEAFTGPTAKGYTLDAPCYTKL
ncbi:ABC transporter substrate-binding protein [Actinomadura barringtoniae]|uniref:ABC transporter substrate-binding protein n=1 Tax=Actinomadura barringtoniae TaxID=1427535 RepID=A0A939T6Y1_9ACTN|nr:ABC transporter substrate-binding protein [Actinomadura barringtoniae]MBO2455466.1 ABC transporter substrate-binding protein [Actinomadura barringtoniae]